MKELFSALSSSEARYFDEERFSESEIRKSLSDSLTDRKVDAMKRILAAVSVGRDASSLFPDVVKNVSFPSLELKKLIYIYLVQYAENNRELALLSINSFQKDLMDRSQQVRASALRAMASIKVLEVIQLVMVAVKTAANDTSPYVRKTAAQCMTKVYAVDNDQFPELRKLLLKLMNDVEVQVVGSAVMAFRHICVVQPPRAPAEAGADEDAQGADKSNKPPEEVLRPQLEHLHLLFRRLVQDMLLMDSWAQQCCVDLLMRYARLFFACPDRKKDASAAAEGGESPAAPAVSEDFQLLLKNLKLLLFSASKGVTLAAAVALCYLAPAEELSGLAMPLLRCLRQATPESSIALLTAMTPLVEAKPELFRPMIREFFVQSLQPADAKQLKLKMMELLVDDSNVQLVLRELQAYVSWHSHPEFVAQAVQCIAQVALKISSVADSCLRGLVKMLDSKCEALSCEAVVSLRALLQRRQRSEDSGLGSVLPHLVSYLDVLNAPTARASVVWIIGHYQQEVPRLAPDVVRRMAKCFASERQEVKQQILTLALKVWAFHLLNSRGDAITGQADQGSTSSKNGGPRVSVEESAQLLPRLEAIVDHISNLAAFDAAWDVRDTARALKKVKEVAKGCLAAGTEGSTHTEQLGVWYCRACVSGTPPVDADGVDASALEMLSKGNSSQAVESTWILGSLAQVLDFPLETYRPLPGWAEENTSDELRKVKVEEAAAAQAKREAPKSISSASVGNISHMENRVQQPSNIKDMPVVSSLEDLDLFYSEAPPPNAGAVASTARPAGAAPSEQVPAATLESVRLTGPVAPVGTAVFGEDDESDEEEASDEEDDSWKYCQQAVASSAPAAPSTDPAAGGFSPPARASETQEDVGAEPVAAAVEAEPAAAADEAQPAAAVAEPDTTQPAAAAVEPDTTQPAAASALSPETMDLI